MTLPNLLAVLEFEEARTAAIRAARVRVDAAADRHVKARRELAALEGRRKPAVTEAALQTARDELGAARLELTRARRALIRTI